jgi:hypothetical protein
MNNTELGQNLSQQLRTEATENQVDNQRRKNLAELRPLPALNSGVFCYSVTNQRESFICPDLMVKIREVPIER